MKKIASLLITTILVSFGLWACGCPCKCLKQGTATAKTLSNKAVHPELTPQEKLTPCAQCHKDVTPDIYKQWYNSGHGLDNVMCFQCHGTYEDLKVTPDTSTCAVCHAREYKKCPSNKTCWECHPAHIFTVHK